LSGQGYPQFVHKLAGRWLPNGILVVRLETMNTYGATATSIAIIIIC